MLTKSKEPYFSADEYLQIEEQSPIKHEYVDGQLYALVGASQNHNTLAANLLSALMQHLRGSGCRVFMSDIKVRIEQRNRFFYPDVVVTCDQRERETPLYLRYPKLVVEVLSDSSEAYDRGAKFLDYQTLESLQEYVLISTKEQLVQCFRRSEPGLWVLQSYTQEDKVYQIGSLHFSKTLEELYENVSF
ncbi:Uma2 family endonuclease [Gloeobacter kilaueensis]|uniref:Putative restriction endonuclease domain-containing protein n=1 Tax=Gloeobacter kilaueensis (strain ATCC BAA-2537 / CCAP 1431/1 / ULC 316 / JS1) TaxID=1183438 RepID=U5QN48_GLOK1|nr:Uma2 family endonuclease [Gloeobacter kilaueensis]AGY59110.1 hypothetical protein GKIL_2864 [Gloeobacter kilaueensis JS1]